jgi:hypothetical protein
VLSFELFITVKKENKKDAINQTFLAVFGRLYRELLLAVKKEFIRPEKKSYKSVGNPCRKQAATLRPCLTTGFTISSQ